MGGNVIIRWWDKVLYIYYKFLINYANFTFHHDSLLYLEKSDESGSSIFWNLLPLFNNLTINYVRRTHTAHKDCIYIAAIFHRNIATLQIHCKMLLHHCCGIAATLKCPLLGILQCKIVAMLRYVFVILKRVLLQMQTPF